MEKHVKYGRTPQIACCLGRNRYFKTSGLEIYEGPVEDTVYLNPITGRGFGTDACRIVIPKEAIAQVADALIEFAPKLTVPKEDDTLPPGRLARLVARFRGGPFPVIG